MRKLFTVPIISASCFFFLFGPVAWAQKIKVKVITTQDGAFGCNIKTINSPSGTQYSMQLTNKDSKAQNLKFINVTFAPDQLIANGTPYMIGADEMQNLDGQMSQLITGKTYENDYSNMYVLFTKQRLFASWCKFVAHLSMQNFHKERISKY